MDNLTYKYLYAKTQNAGFGEYVPGEKDVQGNLIVPSDVDYYTNRLASVQDPTNLTNNYTEDIDNQAALNYTYDAIGNLIHDEKGDIDIVDWTVYGKIERIVKKDGSKIEYTYDASGNRISKTVTPPSGGGGAVITWYVRDAQGNVMSTYVAGDNSLNSGALTQTELHVYGSSRIGVLNLSLNCSGSGLGMASTRTLTRGQKFFELTNHLGNVLATVTDRLVPMPDGNSTMVDYYLADVATATDYYAFGMQMPGRGYSSGAYRYGFNGQEMSKEISSVGNSYTAEFWEYDPRLGRRWNVDPRPDVALSNYATFFNNPINNVDIYGDSPIHRIGVFLDFESQYKEVYKVDKIYSRRNPQLSYTIPILDITFILLNFEKNKDQQDKNRERTRGLNFGIRGKKGKTDAHEAAPALSKQGGGADNSDNIMRIVRYSLNRSHGQGLKTAVSGLNDGDYFAMVLIPEETEDLLKQVAPIFRAPEQPGGKKQEPNVQEKYQDKPLLEIPVLNRQKERTPMPDFPNESQRWRNAGKVIVIAVVGTLIYGAWKYGRYFAL